MVGTLNSCFFCQNLLSDFIEGILPSVRHEQLKAHLQNCPTCSQVHGDLVSSIGILQALPKFDLNHEMALRIAEASEARRRSFFTRRGLSYGVLAVALPVLLLAGVAATFPNLFPWLAYFRPSRDESRFVRYFPLAQGAAEIVEEQGAWLLSRESLMGSVWEEGGLSPEEFEKAFQVKTPKGEPR